MVSLVKPAHAEGTSAYELLRPPTSGRWNRTAQPASLSSTDALTHFSCAWETRPALKQRAPLQDILVLLRSYASRIPSCYDPMAVAELSLLKQRDPNPRWQQVGASTTFLTLAHIALLRALYAFRSPEEVSRFLLDHSFLIPVLLEAQDHIPAFFPAYRQLVLEVLIDPEIVHDRQLALLIQTDVPPREALDGLNRLDGGWWLKASARSRGKLCIHVEYQ